MFSYAPPAAGQLERDLKHRLGEQRHPRRPVGLLEGAAAGKRRRTVEHADVVQTEEAALEQVTAVWVLAIDPPGEVGQQPLERVLEEHGIALAADLALALVHEQRRPRVQRRVDVAEVPFVRRNLAVRVQIAVFQEQLDLPFGKVDVDEGQRHRLHREVPCSEPRVLPFVGHRDHVAGGEVEPSDVAHAAGGGVGRPRVDAVLAQPPVDGVLVVLLPPQEPAQRLAHYVGGVLAVRVVDHRRVEVVGLRPPRPDHAVERGAERLSGRLAAGLG